MEYLRDLAFFVEVAEASSFSRAAARLEVPTSTLSRRIAALEASLGVNLFHRTTRSVTLTEAGQVYYARCSGIVAAARDAHRHLRELAQTPSGVLRLSLEAETGPRLVAPVVAEYTRRYPEVTFDLDLSPRRVDLLSEQYDLAIRLGQLPDSGLIVRRIALLHGGLYASPAYLAAHPVPAHPRDLAAHRRIRLLHQGDTGDWELRRGNETHSVTGASLIAANNMTMIRHLTRLGVGIAVLDELMAAEDVASGAVAPVLPDWTLPPTPISVLTPARLLPAKVRLFVALLAERVGALRG